MAVTQRSSTVAVYAVLHLPPLYPLSLQYSADHRDLHSFPTRRSSDLPGRSRPGERARLAPRTGQCREQSRSEERRVGKEWRVLKRPINIKKNVSLFLSMALCLLLRLFVFSLLRLKRFSTLTLKVL